MTSPSPRPAPPPAAQRDAWLTVRVTREQAAVVALEAAREGVTVSEYVRRALLAPERVAGAPHAGAQPGR